MAVGPLFLLLSFLVFLRCGCCLGLWLALMFSCLCRALAGRRWRLEEMPFEVAAGVQFFVPDLYLW
jgi:hypothetical protein